MRTVALGLAALAFSASAALAQAPLTFAELDTDGDGRLSFAELQVAWPDLTQEEFTAVDADGVGALTPEQVNTLQPTTLPAPDASVPAPDAGELGTGMPGQGTVVDPGSAGGPDFSLGDPNDTGEIDNANDAPVLAPDRSLLDSSDDD